MKAIGQSYTKTQRKCSFIILNFVGIFHLSIYVISKSHDRLERLSFYSGGIGSISPKLLCHFVKYKSISIKSFFKFQLDLKILILWTKFAQKGYFRSKTKKANITIEFCINIRIRLASKFSLKLTI